MDFVYHGRESAAYSAEFNKFDKDRSGFIDVKELSDALHIIKTFKGDVFGSFSPSTTFAKELMAEFGLLDLEGWERVMYYLEHVLKGYSPDGASGTFDVYLQQHLAVDKELDFLTSGRNPEYIAAFQRYDADRSNWIDRRELHAALVHVKQMKDSPFGDVSEATAKMLLGTFGSLNHGGWQKLLHYIEAVTKDYVPDRDGTLEQFVVQGFQKVRGRRVHKVYEFAEAMSDGLPDPKRRRVMENPHYRAAFDKFDDDKSGFIDQRELQNALEEVKRTKDFLHGGAFDLHCRRMLMGVFGVLNRRGWTAMLLFIEDASRSFVAGFDNFEVHIQNLFGDASIDQAKWGALLSDAYSNQFAAFDKDGNGGIDAGELQVALNAVKWQKDFHGSQAVEFSPKTMHLLMGEFGVLPYEKWELMLSWVESQSQRFNPAGPLPLGVFLRQQMRYA